MNTLYGSLIAWVKSGINLITAIEDANVWGIHWDLLRVYFEEVTAFISGKNIPSYPVHSLTTHGQSKHYINSNLQLFNLRSILNT